MMTLINGINVFILIFFVFSAIIYTLLLLTAVPSILLFFNRANRTNIYSFLGSKSLPPVTIIMSIYNEEAFIENSVLSTLRSDYKNLYVMLVNDGSTDKTLERLIRVFDMELQPLVFEEKIKTAPVKGVYVSRKHPNLLMIDKEHSSVGDSLNVGLNACFTPYFMTVDADSILDEKAVSELMFELLSQPNAVAVGGAVYINNGCAVREGRVVESKMPYRLVTALQANEYLRSHLFSRTGWNKFGASMSYSGTASLFRLREVIEVNGFDVENYAQDTEMVMRLHHYMHQKKRPYEIRFNPAATVWTDVPDTFRTYSVQRDRWQRGILKSVLHYKSMFLNYKYHLQGLFSYPIYVLLEVIAPFVECTAYFTLGFAYYFGALNGVSVLLYMLLAWGFTTYLTLSNMLINLITFNRYKKPRDILWMFVLVLIEMFGFRQYRTGVQIYASIHYLFNRLRGKAI